MVLKYVQFCFAGDYGIARISGVTVITVGGTEFGGVLLYIFLSS
jgi:hypothetical protein